MIEESAAIVIVGVDDIVVGVVFIVVAVVDEVVVAPKMWRNHLVMAYKWYMPDR